MTRTILLGVAAAVLVLVGCDAEVGLNDDDPYQDDPNDPVICVGDPDTGMNCKKASEFWDCTAMPNGDVKCTHESSQSPGGASTWTCKVEGSKVICTTPDQDATPGAGGEWDCVSDDTGTTCTKDLPLPPGEGSWTCVLDEFTLTCTASDGTVLPPTATTPPETSGPGTVPPGSGTQDCYEVPPGTTTPATPPDGAWAKLVTKKVQYQGQTALYVRVTFNKMFVDNTYGQYSTPYHNPTGKSLSHTFDQLEESDKAEIFFNNTKGDLVMHAVVDYISASSSAPSGYACLGVTGGEGSMTMGSASDVLAARSSLHVNLNELGHVLTEDSPPTDSADPYKPLDAKYADWIYDVWYEVWVKWSAFGADGPGKVYVTGIHASPSRVGANSIEIVPTPCP